MADHRFALVVGRAGVLPVWVGALHGGANLL